MERFFVDILGPLNPASVHGYRYLLMLVDEYSKFEAVKFLRVESEALEKFKKLVDEHGCPKSLRSDNGTEFTNKTSKTSLLKMKQDRILQCLKPQSRMVWLKEPIEL